MIVNLFYAHFQTVGKSQVISCIGTLQWVCPNCCYSITCTSDCLSLTFNLQATNLHYMAEYGNPMLAMDEAGYYLTSLEAAVAFIERLQPSQLDMSGMWVCECVKYLGVWVCVCVLCRDCSIFFTYTLYMYTWNTWNYYLFIALCTKCTCTWMNLLKNVVTYILLAMLNAV